MGKTAQPIYRYIGKISVSHREGAPCTPQAFSLTFVFVYGGIYRRLMFVLGRIVKSNRKLLLSQRYGKRGGRFHVCLCLCLWLCLCLCMFVSVFVSMFVSMFVSVFSV